MHIHGGSYDFMDGTKEANLKIAETHVGYGMTSMVPTTLTSQKKELLRKLDLYERAHEKNRNGSQLLRMHLEGPYFSQGHYGA